MSTVLMGLPAQRHRLPARRHGLILQIRKLMGNRETKPEATMFKWSRQTLRGWGRTTSLASIPGIFYGPLSLGVSSFPFFFHLDPRDKAHLPLAVDKAEFCLGLAKRRKIAPILLGKRADRVYKARVESQQLAVIACPQSKDSQMSPRGWRMVQQFKAFAEDLSLVPHTHIRWLTNACTPVLGEPDTLFWPL